MREQVLRSVRGCNAVIRNNRAEDAGTSSAAPWNPVHVVRLTGNGARYPLFREVLRAGLCLPDLDLPESLVPSADELRADKPEPGEGGGAVADLKNAVAKGAALALWLEQGHGTVRIAFDTQVEKCLPFDIAYGDLAGNSFTPMFRWQERYADLQPQKVPQAQIPTGSTGARQLTLFKRYPGDTATVRRSEYDPEPTKVTLGYTELLTFKFDRPISGTELEVRFNVKEHRFEAKDVVGSWVIGREPDAEAPYLAPAQRGRV